MKRIVIYCIVFYQKNISRDTGRLPRFLGVQKPTCIYYPTCSEYTRQAVIEIGVTRGLYKGFLRVLRCTPWHTPKVDLFR